LGKYDANERSIILDAELASDAPLGLATLVHGVVSDLLYQNKFRDPIHPELVELAVVGTGLGMLRNNIGLVGKFGSFWDSTQWGVAPRPFLDTQTLAYANAIAAWSREDKTPEWARDIIGELKRPMQNSLKFLFKTNESFFQPSKKQALLEQSQSQWWELAASASPSQQVIAIRHLQSDKKLSDCQESLLLEKLGSANRAIVLHAIAAAERMSVSHHPIASDSVVRELRMLADHRDDEVSAKAMCSLTRLAKLDEITVDVASNMLESSLRHVVFAGAYALSSLDSIPDHTLLLVDRGLVRALQACDYEFVGLFAKAYNRWLDDPRSHVQDLLQDSPEYLPVALDALQHEPDQLISIE
jgi:hypothetical protein